MNAQPARRSRPPVLLGRDEHVEAVTGIRRVRVDGIRPWSPACVIHPDGRVEPLPFTWDRDRLAAAVDVALGGATEVAVDGLTPWWRDRLGVELLDAGPLLSG